MARETSIEFGAIKRLAYTQKIDTIAVPEYMRRRVKTGVEFFDDAYSNGELSGLMPSSVNFLTGSSGAGKSTLALQIATGLARDPNNVVVYNSGEESAQQVRMNCERLNAGGFYIGNDILVTQLLDDRVKKLKAKNPGKQFIIIQDSLQAIDDGKYMRDGAPVSNTRTPIRVCNMLASHAKQTLDIVLIIGQVKKDGSFKGANAIKHIIDSHAEMLFDTKAKSETFGMRLFTVSKNRFAPAGISYVVDMRRDGLCGMGRTTDYAAEADGGDEDSEDEGGASEDSGLNNVVEFGA